MQTKYKILYRYVNETTKTAITCESDYNKTEKFITAQSKQNVTLSDAQKAVEDPTSVIDQDQINLWHQEATQENEQLMIENMANEEKANNLFVFNGTKKVYASKFIPSEYGYLVRDYTKIPEAQMPTDRNDFSKDFILLDGDKAGVGSTKVICKHKCLSKYFSTVTINPTNNFSFYPSIYNYIDSLIMFEYLAPERDNDGQYGEITFTVNSVNNPPTQIDPNTGITYTCTKSADGTDHTYNGSVIGIIDHTYNIPKTIFYSDKYINSDKLSKDLTNFTDSVTFQTSYTNRTGTHYYSNIGIPQTDYNAFLEEYDVKTCSKITITESNLVKYIIPEHEEPTGKEPYFIKDSYKKIEMSPWMSHSVHDSLESALQNVSKLVSMIGKENVKLIKYVPIDQFVKIK